MGRALIWAGLVLIAAGILLNAGWRIPGTVELRGKSWTFYFPLGLCILVSVVGSLLLWLFNRR